ncbi:hypothetical protein A4U61_30835 [Streptomyces sp. H-KF8]|nr:hypothetical protein A4U61_30835 [Streptomyces sp. H-KF8]
MTGGNPSGGVGPAAGVLGAGAPDPGVVTGVPHPGAAVSVPDPGVAAGVLLVPSVAPSSGTSRKPDRETRREPSRKYRKQGMS